MTKRLVLALVAGGVVAGCGAPSSGDEILVSAASSLTEAFTEIERAFEASSEASDVVLNFGGSSLLREQILAGAPADVFASADVQMVDEVAEQGFVFGGVEVFASNRLQIAVPLGNPGEVKGLEDLSRENLLIGLCSRGVPCGDLARDILSAAGVDPSVDTEEPNVRALLVKLEAGELDAGLTYASDVMGSAGVEGIEIPEDVNMPARYAIAMLDSGANPDGASEFISFVFSRTGKEILTEHGFEVP